MAEDAAAEGIGQHVPVFVVNQDANAAQHRHQQRQHPHRFGLDFADDEAAQPADHRGPQQHTHQRAVDGVIAEKSITGRQQKVGAQHPRQQIMHQRHCHKKSDKQQRRDRH